MIPSPPFRFRALGNSLGVCERVWWTTPDLNPTQWTPEPYTLWLRFVLDGLWCVVCCVEYVVCCVEYVVWCVVCCGPCRRAGLVGGRVLLSQAWRQSRRRDRVVALVVGRVSGRVLPTGGSLRVAHQQAQIREPACVLSSAAPCRPRPAGPPLAPVGSPRPPAPAGPPRLAGYAMVPS